MADQYNCLTVLVTLLLFRVSCSLDIYVDKANGIPNSSCWKGGVEKKCSSLSLALMGLQQYNQTTVWVPEGSYDLPSRKNGSSVEEESGDYRFLWMTDIALASLADPGVTVSVHCEPNVGLTFFHVTNFTLSGISVINCGLQHSSTSRNSSTSEFLTFYSALYFLYCSDIMFDHVTVKETPGTGVVMYGTVGRNRITDSEFSNNSALNSSGGGGLYIEFPYCTPNIISGNVSVDCSQYSNVPFAYVSNSEYQIEDCQFVNNTAVIEDEEYSTFILPHLDTHMAFGRGGGLSIFFKNNCTNNSIQINRGVFTGNTALWGAGLFIEHQDTSHNNSFTVRSSLIQDNECFHKTSENSGTGGGGARVGQIFFDGGHVSGNTMLFDNVTFKDNQAYYGGGLSFYTAREPEESSATNTLGFQNCSWYANIARVGSAIDLSAWHPVYMGAIVQPNFVNCTFRMNHAFYSSNIGSFEGIGALYSDSVPVKFSGSVKFESNHQTALACIGARIQFTSDCVADFISNKGRNGGAIALMGLAFMEVWNCTQLNFINNAADVKGGAIYGQSIGDHDLLSSRNCFIRYFDPTVTPFLWNSSFNFHNNTANKKVNSIYATSLLPCLWGGAVGSTKEVVTDVFCWNSNTADYTRWNYSSNCGLQIATSPAMLTYNVSSQEKCDGSHSGACMKVFPGLSVGLPFQAFDDRGNDTTNSTILTARILGRSSAFIDSSYLYISDNSIKIYGKPWESAKIKLETTDPRVIWTNFTVEFSDCPLGMYFNKKAQFCACGDYGNLVTCDPESFTANLSHGAWFGKSAKNVTLAGLCPYCSSLTQSSVFILQPGDEDICKRINRTGTLCGRCLDNNGPITNGESIECHYCPPSDTKYHWVFYLLTEFLPTTIFFFVVVLFNISTTSGPANAFVFFAQIMTTVLKDGTNDIIQMTTNHRSTEKVLKALYIIPYDIWNQNFFHPCLPKFCISPNITSLQLLSTGYVTAAYPLVLVIGFFVLIWAYGRGLGPVVCLCRPVHRLFARFHNI